MSEYCGEPVLYCLKTCSLAQLGGVGTKRCSLWENSPSHAEGQTYWMTIISQMLLSHMESMVWVWGGLGVSQEHNSGSRHTQARSPKPLFSRLFANNAKYFKGWFFWTGKSCCMSVPTKGQGQNGQCKIFLVFVTQEMKWNFWEHLEVQDGRSLFFCNTPPELPALQPAGEKPTKCELSVTES